MKQDRAALGSGESLKLFLDTVAQELPIIRPIKEFIHLNLLLPYQHLPFWEALKLVSSKFEAMPFAELTLYRDKIKEGFLPLLLVEEKLKRLAPAENHKDLIERLLRGDFEFTHHDLRVGRLHHLWNKNLGVNIIQLADGMLIKWLGMYFDQGIGLWEMPGSEEKSFYFAMKDLLQESYVKPAPFSATHLEELFPDTAEQAIFEHLSFLCPDLSSQAEYLRESIFTIRGWAGLIYTIERNPTLIPFKRKVSLVDFLAVKLTLERAWILDHDRHALAPDFSKAERPDLNPLLKNHNFELFRACQEALEEVTYKGVLKGVRILVPQKEVVPRYQMVFCMDDREEALRRHLEDLIPDIETLGTAGHYGMEAIFQRSDDAFGKKQCPAPLTPKYLLRDVVKSPGGTKEDLYHHQIQPSHSFFEDTLHSVLGGIESVAKLSLNLFFPLAFKSLENVREVSVDSALQVDYAGESTPEGLKVGYTTEEMVDLVHGQLMLIGFVHRFAPLIFITGHGSNSVNNPYFATYGCGACSGRPGSANARAFCYMANHKTVRARLLEKHGIKIPDDTHFVPAFHDTCRDVVEIYDAPLIPTQHKASYENFKKHLSLAIYKNARERSQMFKLVTYRTVSREAQKEVLRRSYSLFETRPELGHTNVAFAIVGRRSLTKGLDFVRRAFLQSYDRTIDGSGDILAGSLGAVIPVCSGINLDYFFSRVDNLRFGAGSKLPQNIVGNIGVSHGTESDLLVGLPFQMIDQHTPLRLFVLVEQSPEIALYAVTKNPLVKEIVFNNWVYYACWDEDTKSFYLFENGRMVKSAPLLEGLC